MNNYIRIIMLLIGTLTVIGLGVMHEEVHKAIFASYGIDSQIYYFKEFPDFVTIATNVTQGQCNDSCLLAHNLNEVIGYPLTVISAMIFLMLFFIINEVSLRNEPEVYYAS
jgi:hypothetical protein